MSECESSWTLTEQSGQWRWFCPVHQEALSLKMPACPGPRRHGRQSFTEAVERASRPAAYSITTEMVELTKQVVAAKPTARPIDGDQARSSVEGLTQDDLKAMRDLVKSMHDRR